MSDPLPVLAALITLGLGLLGLLAPGRIGPLVALAPTETRGRSEFRATYGGLLVAVALACLVLRSETAFLVAGLAWLGTAAGRAFSVFADGARAPFNLASIAFEAAVGFMFLA